MIRPIALFLLLLGLLLTAWWIIAITDSTRLIPGPSSVMSSLVDNRGPLMRSAFTTAKQACLGILFAMLAAAAIVCIAARVPDFERAIYPFVVMLKATPALAFVPLIMTVIGGGLVGKACVAGIISFLPLAVGALSGLHDVPGPLRTLRRNCQPGNWRFFSIVAWPYALHGYCLGLELAAPMAVVGAIVSDFILGGANSGLGSFITGANSAIKMANVAAGGLAATVLGVGLFFCAHSVFGAVRKRLHLAT